jgi:polyferredoxin
MMLMNAMPSKAAERNRIDLHRLRLLVQSGFLLFCLYCGYRFYQFYRWTLGSSPTYVARPPAIEGFLPIGALVSLKRFLLTGVYDQIHPAGLTIFIAALLLAVFFRKGFCGWICPVGFTSQLIERLARKLKLLWRPPPWLDYPLLAPKYLLLAFFAWLILVGMDLASIEAFSNAPYNLVVDARMLLFFLAPSATTIWVLTVLVTATFFLRNFWCRSLCPYGALLGLLAWFGPLRVSRDGESCINCKKCEKVCPGAIRVAEKSVVTSPECLGCLECMAACPVSGCLQLTTYRKRQLPPWLLPLGAVTLFLTIWAVAQLSGHWQSAVPPEILKNYYPLAARLAHP